MRVQHQIILTVSDDAAALQGEFSRSANLAPVVADNFTAATSGTFYLPDTQQAVTLSLGDVASALGLYLEVDGPAALVVNGGAPLALAPSQGNGLAKVFLECTIASLGLSAAQAGVAVRGRWTAWGFQPPLSAES